jgi:hypothetical protein
MEASAPQSSNPATTGPEAGSTEASAPKTQAEKVLFGGQEMEIDAFFRAKKHKAKVDGKEFEVDYDELVNGYGHKKAANERMREAAEARKRADAKEKALVNALQNWKTNPESAFQALEKLGIDIDDYAHKRVLKKMEYELMSDEERQQFHDKEELTQYRTEAQKRQEAERQRQLKEMETKSLTDLEQNILGYIQQTGRNFTPELVGRAVDHIISALEQGQEIGIDEAFKRAEGWYKKTSNSIFQNELKSMVEKGEVPKELAELVRKADIAQVRNQPPKRQPVQESTTKKTANSMDDFFGDLDRRYKK